jgi:hypothetical protein
MDVRHCNTNHPCNLPWVTLFHMKMVGRDIQTVYDQVVTNFGNFEHLNSLSRSGTGHLCCTRTS